MLLPLLGGCVLGPVLDARQGAAPPDGESWREARRDLRRLRAAYAPARPYTMNLALEMTHPLTGNRLRARGAVAVAPAHRALRMILLGPGGTTALDLWVCRDRFRFALPAVGLVQRGDASTPRERLRGLPVDFLRWWLLRPLDGHLLYVAEQGESRRYVLRDRNEVVDFTTAGAGGVALERRSRWDRQSVRASGPGCAGVQYAQASTGIDITVECEKLDPQQQPRPEAFADPDAPEQICRLQPGAPS